MERPKFHLQGGTTALYHLIYCLRHGKAACHVFFILFEELTNLLRYT